MSDTKKQNQDDENQFRAQKPFDEEFMKGDKAQLLGDDNHLSSAAESTSRSAGSQEKNK